MKFLCLVLIFLSFQVFAAEVKLTDATNPKTKFKSMGDCLKSVDTTLVKDAGQINQANDKIYDCIMMDQKEYAVPTEHFVCANGVRRIQDNKELKVSAAEHCNMHYAESMTCVKQVDKLTDAVKKKAKARKCINDNYAYFTPEFCIEMLKKADLEADQELLKTCTQKHENAPPSVTPAKPNRR